MLSKVSKFFVNSESESDKQTANNHARVLVDDALDIVNCRLNGVKLAGGYAACLEARFIPNQRLITVFGRNNAFTTMDQTRGREFFKEAWKKIDGVKEENWGHM